MPQKTVDRGRPLSNPRAYLDKRTGHYPSWLSPTIQPATIQVGRYLFGGGRPLSNPNPKRCESVKKSQSSTGSFAAPISKPKYKPRPKLATWNLKETWSVRSDHKPALSYNYFEQYEFSTFDTISERFDHGRDKSKINIPLKNHMWPSFRRWKRIWQFILIENQNSSRYLI